MSPGLFFWEHHLHKFDKKTWSSPLEMTTATGKHFL